MNCPKCKQPTMWNPYIHDIELYICYNIQCNHHQRIKPKEEEDMSLKKRMTVGLKVFIVIPEGVLKGVITKSMVKGMYVVQTFLGNITINEGKIYERNDFGRASNLYQSLHGDR